MANQLIPNGWSRFILSILLPLLAFAVGYGVLQSNVQHNRELIELKMDRQVADTRYDLMREQLKRIEIKLDELAAQR